MRSALGVWDNKRIPQHKVFKGSVEHGNTSLGWFYGFKLHAIINSKGELIRLKQTPVNIDDCKSRCQTCVEGCLVNDLPTGAILLDGSLKHWPRNGFSWSRPSRKTWSLYTELTSRKLSYVAAHWSKLFSTNWKISARSSALAAVLSLILWATWSHR